ncbi:MAG: transglutaminase family protein, partial [Gluconacetobacter diazotrophicus]|nr:transglutaminase family protein [Gluconacetobacter diazotrophicus]
LSAVCAEIARSFTYAARHEEGVQEPARTLGLRTGTCRDFAVLMMEAARVMGFASRFVSGYVDPHHDPDRGDHNRGGGATHAWMEAFIPGLGWTEFDPTNDIVGTRDLIRVGSVGHWRQAVPLSGTWTGFPADALGMTVNVLVTRGRHSANDAGTASARRNGIGLDAPENTSGKAPGNAPGNAHGAA